MTAYKTIKDLGDLNGKVVMLRADLNVPMDENFHVTNTARIDRTVPTIKTLMEKGAKVVVISHFGRPEGKGDMKNSLSHVAPELEKALGHKVVFVDDCIGSKVEAAVKAMKGDEVLLLENLRFYNEEKKGDEKFAEDLVKPADVYVSDAFSTAHRAHASMVAAVKLRPSAMGLLMEEEVNALTTGLNDPKRPLMAIVGGSKVSTKLTILKHLAPLVDTLIVGGGIANTFLLAQGHHIGTSLAEPALVGECKEVMKIMKEKGGHLPLPVDVVVAHHIGYDAGFRICDLDDIEADEMILDIGPKTSKMLSEYLKDAKTIIWNGPVGVFEMDNFKEGTRDLAEKVAEATANGAFTIVGGGDTIAAAKAFNVADKVSYISTGGGAFLEFLEGKTLPAIAALQERTR